MKAEQHQIPEYTITSARPNKDFAGCLVVTIDCPCGRQHEHGWIMNDTRRSHRIAHCADHDLHPHGYFISMPKTPMGVKFCE
jgi:hypothetical protein